MSNHYVVQWCNKCEDDTEHEIELGGYKESTLYQCNECQTITNEDGEELE